MRTLSCSLLLPHFTSSMMHSARCSTVKDTILYRYSRGRLSQSATKYQAVNLIVISPKSLCVRESLKGGSYRTEAAAAALLSPTCKLWGCNGSLCAASGLLNATGAGCFFAIWAAPLIRQIVELAMDGRHRLAQTKQMKLYRCEYLGMTWGTPR